MFGKFSSLIERADRFFGSYNAAAFYYDVVFRAASSWGVSCFNYGYAPASDAVRSETRITEPFQIEMYHQAAIAAGADRLRDAVALEISCGLGGGLAYIAGEFAVSLPIALDRATGGVRSARKRFALPALKADALALPLSNASVDVVFNVEASHIYFNDTFLGEVRRVLKPGGCLVLIDSRDLTPADSEAYLRENFGRSRLALTSFRDITTNVVESCEADTPRRERLLSRLPFFIRPPLRPMLGVQGSSRYECFRGRKTTYFISTAEPI